ncbi:DUF4031 domain-containing protein [Xanthomonas albilineans]|uniref:DUF4031 domain-containing protein n=1 Tax=Xanthomonas albilineans TaxID=29447 RepID=UPI0005F32AF2|nr:DUF4031 domain-containing protein [Xanthomonas albilineans]
MAVYIDDAVHPWRGQRWGHLLADTLDELHAMAAQLGIPRRAFQNKRSGARYDIPAPLREEVIRLGAIPVSRHTHRKQMKALIHQARAQARGEAN